MPDQSTDPNEEIKISKYAQEQIDKVKDNAILVEQIKRDLRTNPRYKEFFDQYDRRSVERFIKDYLLRLNNKVKLSEEEMDDTWDNMRKEHKQDLIEGRVMNGEPPDLNF